MKLDEYYKIKSKEWYHSDVDMKDAADQHTKNIGMLKNALDYKSKEGRPITITILHGSGRHPEISCANEMSNSEMLCEKGLELALNELDSPPNIWRYKLREMTLEPCNACYSTTSALCNFSCTCIEGTQRVLTKEGWIAISELVGRKPEILTHNGKWVKASKVWSNGFKPVLEIKTKGGRTLKCTEDHLILTKNGWVEARNLAKKDIIIAKAPPSYAGNSYEISEDFSEALGFIWGDGWITHTKKNKTIGSCSSIEDKAYARLQMTVFSKLVGNPIREQVKLQNTKINGYIYKDRPVWYGHVSCASLIPKLEKLGADKWNSHVSERDIPKFLFTAAPEIQVSFLRGLFSADGSVTTRTGYSNCFVRLYQSSERLLKSVSLLLQNFGIKSKISPTRNQFVLDVVSVPSVQQFRNIVGFGLDRKNNLLNKHISVRRSYEKWEFEVISIDYLDDREVFDIAVPEDHSFLVEGLLVHNCFPADDITKTIYPAIMASDILFISTPVNQSMVSSRVKIVLDRLISLDGGYYTETLPKKDHMWRQKMIDLSANEPVYDQRMHNLVAGYFVTSKDANNPHEESVPMPAEFKRLSYVDFVVGALAHQGSEYGWRHAKDFYVLAAADPDVDMALDKSHYDKDTKSHEEAKQVILSSIKLAQDIRENPDNYKFKNPGRINRT